MTYAEKLQDPRWITLSSKKKALVGCCEGCKAAPPDALGFFNLAVHHKFYDGYREPWEYELNELVCLCKTCHLMLHFRKHYPGIINTGVSPRGWRVLSQFLSSIPEECYPRIQVLSFKADRIVLKWIFVDGIEVPHYQLAMKMLEYHQARIPPKTGPEKATGLRWLLGEYFELGDCADPRV